MEIVKVENEAGYRYIPLKGWDSVVAAVNTFANGGSRASQATTQNQIRAVGETSGGLGLGLYMLGAPHMQGAGNQFVERLLEEAKGALTNRNKWNRHYDYDGMGVFFKTSVEIGVLDAKEGMYYLSIWAAYVGDQPEEGLAEALNIPRALTGCVVTVEVPPADADHFALDFEAILRKLDGVLPVSGYTGKEVLEVLEARTADRYGSETAVPIYRDGDIIVSVGTGRVENRFKWNNGESTDTWTFDGATLSGLLAESYQEGKDKDEPSVVLRVYRHSEDKYERNPFYKPEEKERVLALAENIAAALRA